jgi:hypothetical protein
MPAPYHAPSDLSSTYLVLCPGNPLQKNPSKGSTIYCHSSLELKGRCIYRQSTRSSGSLKWTVCTSKKCRRWSCLNRRYRTLQLDVAESPFFATPLQFYSGSQPGCEEARTAGDHRLLRGAGPVCHHRDQEPRAGALLRRLDSLSVLVAVLVGRSCLSGTARDRDSPYPRWE